MEKIFQILIVFALLIFAITWFLRSKERKWQDYVFSGQFTFPLSGDMHRDLLTAVVGDRHGEDAIALAGLAELEWEANADVILFDPVTRLIYCGSMEGVVTIIRQSTQGGYKTLQQLIIPKECTALSLDPHTGKLYVHVGATVFVYINV
jgi:hypothetical protein